MIHQEGHLLPEQGCPQITETKQNEATGKAALPYVPRAFEVGTGFREEGKHVPVSCSVSPGSSTAARNFDSKVAHSSGWQISRRWHLELKIGVPLFLSTGCLDLPTARWRSSKSKNKNKQDTQGAEAASPLRSRPRDSHNVSFAVFYYSSNHRAQM